MPRPPFDPNRIPDRDSGPPARRERKRAAEQTPDLYSDVPPAASADGVAGASASAKGADPAASALSVSQVSELVKRAIADRLPTRLKVVGEISNFTERSHWYFSLKDENAVLSCVMWASAARKCGFRPAQGQQVVASGRFDYFPPQGRIQFYVESLQPVGRGALELRLRQLIDQLRAEGYFDEQRKRPLPAFPQRIAVVTSATGAALQDVIKTARQRWKGCSLLLADVRVQGAEAAPEIAAAIRRLSELKERLAIDAIILTRGGGSLEDLWAFNEKIVADAIFHSRIPIVAAIGHETDVTVAELAADLRCSTPTQAAMRLVPAAAEYGHLLGQMSHRLSLTLRRAMQDARHRLAAASRHPLFARPAESINLHRRELDGLARRLAASMRQTLSDWRRKLADHAGRLSQLEPRGRLKLARHQLDSLEHRLRAHAEQATAPRRRELDQLSARLERLQERLRQAAEQKLTALEKQLHAVGPRSVLRRGYSYTTRPDGKVVRSAVAVGPGDHLVLHFEDGRVHSEVLRSGRQDIIPRKGSRAADKPGEKSADQSLFE